VARDYFGSDAWHMPSNIEIPDGIDLKLPISKTSCWTWRIQGGVLALKHLTPLQASDERIWAYLSHVSLWIHAQALAGRAVRGQTSVRGDRAGALPFLCPIAARADSERNRPVVWYGFTTYDESWPDPFELTGVLLKNLDVMQSISSADHLDRRDSGLNRC